MTDPMTSLHLAANGNFVNGAYAPGVDGFNLADVSSRSVLDAMPADVKGLVYIGMTDGVTAAFQAAVNSFIGDSKVFGFYIADEPAASPTIAANLKAESDWIHANDPGAKTFIVEMNLSSNTSPTYYYTPANTDIDLFGLDPYPVQANVPNNLDYGIIPLAVQEAEAVGISLQDIVPVYQAFGGGNYTTFYLPTAAQEQQILATWGSVVPTPVFDYAYSWGVQQNDTALSDDPELQAVFAAHNALTSGSPPPPSPPTLANAGNVVDYSAGGAATFIDSALTVNDASSATLSGASVAITGGLMAGDVLEFASQNGIAGSYDSATGVLTLTGDAPLAAYQAALESVAYASTAADPTGGGGDVSRAVTFVASSGGLDSAPVQSTVNIVQPPPPIDPPPTVAFSGAPTVGSSGRRGTVVTFSGLDWDAIGVTNVEIYSGSLDLGAATLNPDGTWSFSTKLSIGTYSSFTAVATDATGDVAAALNPFSVTVTRKGATVTATG